MTKYIFGLFFIAIFSVSSAQNAAKIVFENEIHDFGELPEGPRVRTEFVFKNTGKEPLLITNAKGSCGCTVPEWPKEPIMPGKKAVIKVEFNTAGRPGPFIKTVTITSNTEVANTVLKIRGTVIKRAPVEPEEETMPVKEPLFMAPGN